MDDRVTLDRDAANALARFAADAYGIALLSGRRLSAEPLVESYRRALVAGARGGSDDRFWFAFYVRLEAFSQVALGVLSTPYPPEVLSALLGFQEILSDDFGSDIALRGPAKRGIARGFLEIESLGFRQ